MSVIQLLHGTDHIIEVPDIHIGNPHNDYGMGFYCTRVDEMAREWACKKNTDGFVNSYDFDTDGLKVLNLFAYTGGATVAAAMACAEVTHVDASRGMVTWAHENANSSGRT